MFHSQIGQDAFLDTFFQGERGGVFVDIGAHDGQTYSNTLYLEEERGWRGICIEPLPEIFARLKQRRACHCVQACVGAESRQCEFLRVRSDYVNVEMLSGVVANYDPRHRQRVDIEVARHGGSVETIKVEMKPLATMVKEAGFSRVDYISLDTEGSELSILKSINLRSLSVRCLTVENNYGDGAIGAEMTRQGYKLLRTIEYDDVYVPT